MLLDDVIARLMALRATHGGNIHVMVANGEGDVWGTNFCDLRVAEADEFPADWNMPDGFTFVCVSA